MKNFLKQRYHLHLLAGALVMIIGFILAAFSRWLENAISLEVGVHFDSLRFWELGLIGFVIAGIAGLTWEMHHYPRAKFDFYDVLWTGIGGAIVSILYFLL